MPMILMAILNGCATKTCDCDFATFPDLPEAGPKVGQELYDLCSKNIKNCSYINDFFNRLYKFKTIYNPYKEYYDSE